MKKNAKGYKRLAIIHMYLFHFKLGDVIVYSGGGVGGGVGRSSG